MEINSSLDFGPLNICFIYIVARLIGRPPLLFGQLTTIMVGMAASILDWVQVSVLYIYIRNFRALQVLIAKLKFNTRKVYESDIKFDR